MSNLRREKATLNKLSNAIKVFDNLKKYCLKANVKIISLKACLRGVNELIDIDQLNIQKIAKKAVYSNRILVKFKCNIDNAFNLPFKFGAYEIPLDNVSLSTLKSKLAVKIPASMKQSYYNKLKQWASKNKIYFHEYNRPTLYLYAFTYTDENETSHNLGVNIEDEKIKITPWLLNVNRDEFDEQSPKYFDDIKDVILYLDSWVKERKKVTSCAKQYLYNGKVITASNKQEAVQAILSVSSLSNRYNSFSYEKMLASAEEITAGLIWGVEGIEKLPKYGDVLFYIVNGTRYGVRPHRGSKHDIEWYFKQLKAGMQADKGYAVGLTQYLNTWVRKKELDIVFKGKA